MSNPSSLAAERGGLAAETADADATSHDCQLAALRTSRSCTSWLAHDWTAYRLRVPLLLLLLAPSSRRGTPAQEFGRIVVAGISGVRTTSSQGRRQNSTVPKTGLMQSTGRCRGFPAQVVDSRWSELERCRGGKALLAAAACCITWSLVVGRVGLTWSVWPSDLPSALVKRHVDDWLEESTYWNHYYTTTKIVTWYQSLTYGDTE